MKASFKISTSAKSGTKTKHDAIDNQSNWFKTKGSALAITVTVWGWGSCLGFSPRQRLDSGRLPLLQLRQLLIQQVSFLPQACRVLHLSIQQAAKRPVQESGTMSTLLVFKGTQNERIACMYRDFPSVLLQVKPVIFLTVGLITSYLNM